MRVPRDQTQSGSFSRVREEPGNEVDDFKAPALRFVSVRILLQLPHAQL